MKKKQEKVFALDPAKSPVGIKNVFLRSVVEHVIGLPKLDKLVFGGRAETPNALEGECFSDCVLRGMRTTIDLSDEDRQKIPKTGPVIVVANHPFGGIEGVVLMSILNSIRQDYKVMANYFLKMIPEMSDDFIAVDPFGTEAAAKKNIRSLMETIKWVKDGHILGVFPAGEVSSIDLKSGRVRDPKWAESIGAIVRKTGATVVPMFFGGRNPALFQLAGLIHPRFRTFLLPKMLQRKTRSEIKVCIGNPITPSELVKFEKDEDLIKYLRLRSYALEARLPEKERKIKLFKRKTKQIDRSKFEPIIEETPLEQLEAEIAALPPEAFMLEGAGLKVYMTKLTKDSAIMRELSRLREITFRSVGEGTGLSHDTDVFDAYYHHLFLWNVKDRRIAGAYRLGLADEIQKEYGIKGLYTHTLFKFNDKLLSKFQPAIELGRSFVRPEYQRAFSSLLYLWKGIGTFISRNPQYTNLFGPVSISADYKDSSRNMLLRSLRISNFANDLTKLVKARKPPRKFKKKHEWVNPDFEEIISNIDDVSTIISEIESDHKGIPVLVKQYLKLGGKILCFNLDTDFCDVVDGLILIDLRKTDAKSRSRYMGEEADALFKAYHKLD